MEGKKKKCANCPAIEKVDCAIRIIEKLLEDQDPAIRHILKMELLDVALKYSGRLN